MIPVRRRLPGLVLLGCLKLISLLSVLGCDFKSTPSNASTAAPGGLRFREIGAANGLEFRWGEKLHRPLRALDAVGTGCAFFDYDEDGDQDILLVSEPTVGLFKNDGQGRFANVTAATGLDRVTGRWKGCAIGDYDGDGRRDLVLTGFHCLALVRNELGNTFRDVTRHAGLDPANHQDWATSAGFMDLDSDGDLELLVQNYVVWGPGVREYCFYNGIKMGCPPKIYEPEFGRLYRNDRGRFTDVSKAAGFAALTGIGLVIGFADADSDGAIDIYLGNDAVDADFLKNLGSLKFRDVALENGTIYNSAAKPMAAMGVDWADYDRDGDLDFAVTDFSHASYAVYRNDGHATFDDVAAQLGIAAPTYDPLGFGAKFVDADNDGWPDLFFSNGHVYDDVAKANPPLTFRQSPMLFRNLEGKRFEDVVPRIGGDLARPIVGRGSATADVDNDGRIDLLAVDLEGAPVLLRNESENGNHWVTLDLRAKAPNHFAYGARVTLTHGSTRWTAEVSPTSSYQSSSDPRVHFGLGAVDRIQRLEIRWPTGERQELRDLPVDRILTLEQGRPFSTDDARGR